jgi:hypothetical protein
MVLYVCPTSAYSFIDETERHSFCSLEMGFVRCVIKMTVRIPNMLKWWDIQTNRSVKNNTNNKTPTRRLLELLKRVVITEYAVNSTQLTAPKKIGNCDSCSIDYKHIIEIPTLPSQKKNRPGLPLSPPLRPRHQVKPGSARLVNFLVNGWITFSFSFILKKIF